MLFHSYKCEQVPLFANTEVYAWEFNRGEAVDREDDPEYNYSQSTWEDDLKQYLPETGQYQAGTSSRPPPSGISDVASTSSRPPMVPPVGTGNASVDLLLGIKKSPQSLAAYRWHKAYQFVKKQNVCGHFLQNTRIFPRWKSDDEYSWVHCLQLRNYSSLQAVKLSAHDKTVVPGCRQWKRKPWAVR
jgi:hypothetical protein